MPATTPSLISEILPAIGVLAGVSCKALFDFLADRRKARIDGSKLHITDKRIAYAQLAYLVDGYRRVLDEVADCEQAMSKGRGTRRTELRLRLDQLEAKRDDLFEQLDASASMVELLCPSAVRIAVQSVAGVIYAGDRTSIEDARGNLVRAMRTDLFVDNSGRA